jgi:hypothetical protein
VKERVIDTDGQPLTKITYENGDILYFNTKNQLHRIGGPARIWLDDYQSYWVNDKLHRIGGPAAIKPDGTQWYYVDGIEYTQEQYPQAVLQYKLKQLVG